MSGPLEDLRIVDLSRIVAGPLATQILGDYGAEVIKVEHPQGGDDSRQWAPPRAPDGQASYFFAVNRGKRSITIDLKHPRGKALVLDLVRRGDVLDRELQARNDGRPRARLGDAAGGQPAADLLRDLGLRSDRAVPRAGGVRRHHAGLHRPHVDHRRERRRTGQGRRRADRRDHGALRPRGDPRSAAPPGTDRTGPVPRALAHGVRHRRADQRGDGVPGGRGGAGAVGERASVARAVPGLPRPGRLPDGRRRQRAPVEGVLRGARGAGVGRRPSLRVERPAGGVPGGAGAGDRGAASRHGPGTSGSAGSRRPGFPRDRSTTSGRSSRILRYSTGRWRSRWIIRLRVGSGCRGSR